MWCWAAWPRLSSLLTAHSSSCAYTDSARATGGTVQEIWRIQEGSQRVYLGQPFDRPFDGHSNDTKLPAVSPITLAFLSVSVASPIRHARRPSLRTTATLPVLKYTSVWAHPLATAGYRVPCFQLMVWSHSSNSSENVTIK
ncbi:hypothetical protein C8R43DRAFT_1023454 [Mycena crocata]|nr:hypothetical protein C8R43DRAFT_1023454 [Mycena crocata]